MTSVKKCKNCKQYKKNIEVKQVGIQYQCLTDCHSNSESEGESIPTLDVASCRPVKARKSPKKKGARIQARKSTAIRNSACGEVCTLRVSPQCDHNQTVVGCHLNTPFKGAGLKSPDIFIVYGCYSCHNEYLDKGKVSDKDKLRALFESQKIMLDKGLIVVK